MQIALVGLVIEFNFSKVVKIIFMVATSLERQVHYDTSTKHEEFGWC